jgi:hypothetical protein
MVVVGCPPMIVKFQLPTSQNLEVEQQFRIFGITILRNSNVSMLELMYQKWTNSLKSAIPRLWIYLPKKQILKSWGWDLAIHAGQLIFFPFVGEQAVLEGIMTGIFGILGSSITE